MLTGLSLRYPRGGNRKRSHHLTFRYFVVGCLVLGTVSLVGLGVSEPVGASSVATTAFVVNMGDNTVSVIDLATNTISATIPVGASPTFVAVTRRHAGLRHKRG